MATKNGTILSLLVSAPYWVGALVHAFLPRIAAIPFSDFNPVSFCPRRPAGSCFGSLSAGFVVDLSAWSMADLSVGVEADRSSVFQYIQVSVIQLLHNSHL